MSVVATALTDDNGFVVDHRQSGPASGNAIPAVKIFANEKQYRIATSADVTAGYAVAVGDTIYDGVGQKIENGSIYL